MLRVPYTELYSREEISAIYQRKMAALARKAERDKNKPPKVKEKTQMTGKNIHSNHGYPIK